MVTGTHPHGCGCQRGGVCFRLASPLPSCSLWPSLAWGWQQVRWAWTFSREQRLMTGTPETRRNWRRSLQGRWGLNSALEPPPSSPPPRSILVRGLSRRAARGIASLHPEPPGWESHLCFTNCSKALAPGTSQEEHAARPLADRAHHILLGLREGPVAGQSPESSQLSSAAF